VRGRVRGEPSALPVLSAQVGEAGREPASARAACLNVLQVEPLALDVVPLTDQPLVLHHGLTKIVPPDRAVYEDHEGQPLDRVGVVVERHSPPARHTLEVCPELITGGLRIARDQVGHIEPRPCGVVPLTDKKGGLHHGPAYADSPSITTGAGRRGLSPRPYAYGLNPSKCPRAGGTAGALRELKARSSGDPGDPVFWRTPGIEPLSEEVTPYSFRRTYSSLRASRWIDAEGNMRPGDDPVYIAEQMGHTDPKFTFRVYQRAVKRRERLSGAHLEAFDKALQWAAMGSGAPGPVVPNLPNAASIQGMPG
jgi:hypothetical protein